MQTYDEMVDSGVDWIGQIPHSWRVKKFSSLYKTTNAGEVIPKEFWDPDGQLIMYTASQKPIRAIFSRFPESKLTTDNDILIARNGDGVIHDPRPGSIYTNVVQRVSLDIDSVSKKYLIYALKASLSYVHGQSNGDFIVSLNMGMWNSTRLPMPASPVQQKIADFLDTETAKIDNLIAKQERLLELLEEKRRATITHAVTRGLNPNAELKEIDIDWIQRLPREWKIAPLSSMFTFSKGKEAQKLTAEYVALHQGVYPVYSGQTSNKGVLGLYDKYEFDLRSGAILVTTVGAKAMTSRYIDGKLSLSQNCLIMLPKNMNVISQYFSYAVIPLFIKERALIPDHMQPSMRMSHLGSYRLPVPSIEEQLEISKYLVAYEVRVDRLKEKIMSQITLLRERRTSLISHAVTGKVKI